MISLITQLLIKNPKKRIGYLEPSEIKNHIWIKDYPWDKLLNKEIIPPFVPVNSDYNFDIKHVIVAGGVASNSHLRDEVKKMCDELNVSLTIPVMKYCTDNGAMIAAAGYYAYLDGRVSDLYLNSKSSTKLC